MIWHISANRDEEVFDDPFVFDITRNPNPHVAFGGGGSHFCLGANLARMELQLIFEELATRLPDMQLAGEPDRLLSNFIGGIKHMPVKWTPGPNASSPRLDQLGRDPARARSTGRPAPPRSTRIAKPLRGCACSTARRGSPASWSRSTVTRSCCAVTPGSRSATATCPAPSRSTARRRTSSRYARPTADDGRARRRRGAYRVGSRAVVGAKARVARGSRIWVEGVHDAELVEKVWGDDLRVEGIVVERLDGADHLADEVRAFGPGRDHRLGVLLDHLVPGSKEARLAAAVRHPHVLVTGHALRRRVAGGAPEGGGIEAWPVVPKGQDWKTGVCAALGVDEPCAMWRRILGSVHDWKQLEQPFVAAVEQLIDFLTEPRS